MQAVVISHVLQKPCTSGSFFTAGCRVLFCCVSKGSFSMHLPIPTHRFSGMKILDCWGFVVCLSFWNLDPNSLLKLFEKCHNIGSYVFPLTPSPTQDSKVLLITCQILWYWARYVIFPAPHKCVFVILMKIKSGRRRRDGTNQYQYQLSNLVCA